MTTDFGTVTAEDGTLVKLTQQAYADNYGTDGGIVYRANGEDAEGNEYKVIWQTTLAWDASSYINACEMQDREIDPDILKKFGVEPDFCAYSQDDESDACDWDNYEVTRS